MATKEQIKRIYGLGAGLGIVGKDKDDMLHELIFSIDRKSTRLNSSHRHTSRMPSSA